MLPGRMRKIDKRTTLPLRIPKTGAVARSIVLFWTFTMSNSKDRSSPFRRAKCAAHMHGNSVDRRKRAAANADARAHARVMSVG